MFVNSSVLFIFDNGEFVVLNPGREARTIMCRVSRSKGEEPRGVEEREQSTSQTSKGKT
jgi:hypothetical protein